eukprot:10513788-Lingulodinium_polyedra.AAC.1
MSAPEATTTGGAAAVANTVPAAGRASATECPGPAAAGPLAALPGGAATRNANGGRSLHRCLAWPLQTESAPDGEAIAEDTAATAEPVAYCPEL